MISTLSYWILLFLWLKVEREMAAEDEVKSEPLADSPTSVLEDEVFSFTLLWASFFFFSFILVFCW